MRAILSRGGILGLILVLTAPVFAATSAPAPAKQPTTKQQPAAKSLGTFGNWKAFSYTQNGQPVCYMTLAMKTTAGHMKRGAAYLMITHRPGEGSKDVISFTSGYNFKPTSDVTAVIGKKSFDLFTETDTAWTRDPGSDHAMASAISQNNSIKITGTPAAKGTKPVSDAVDLKGSLQAYQAISKACGIPVETPPKAAAPAAHKGKTTPTKASH
jgi:hypothetical protein